MHDVIVIGGGAAGLSAALLLGRARRRVLLIDAAAPRNAPAAHMHGYPALDGLPPSEFLDRARAEVVGYGVEVVPGTVVEVTSDREVLTTDGERRSARRVVVATGAVDTLPEIPRFAERWGRDVIQCPYCHGWEVRDQRLAVLGTNPGAVLHALMVRQWSPSVTLLAHTQSVTEEQREALGGRGIPIVQGAVQGLQVVADSLVGVRLEGGEVVGCDAVFLPPQLQPRDGFLDGLGLQRDERGFLCTDRDGRTDLPWLYAAGNSADPRAQVVTAAGQGSSVGFALNHDLVMEGPGR